MAIEITAPVFNEKSWKGLAAAYGMKFFVELFPSQEYPGYHHMSLACVSDREFPDTFIDSTQRPVKTDNAQEFLKVMLRREGLLISDFVWEELSDMNQLILEHPEVVKNKDQE
jgi:hypothetical protein